MKEEEEQETFVKNNKEDYLIHYKKINVMGDEGVGKTSLITFFENYYNKEFVIKSQTYSFEKTESEVTEESNIQISSLVENVKRITVEYDGTTNLYLNIYETNLNDLENIKNYLDTLLFQTECIIFIFDKSNINSLQNIKKLIPIINQKKLEKKIRNIPIFLLENKVDLQDIGQENIQKITDEIQNIKDKYNDLIIFQEISLYIRDKFEDFINDFNKYCYSDSKIDEKDLVNLIKLNDPLRQIENNIKYSQKIRFSLIGETSVGKTSFINSFFSKNIGDLIATIGNDVYRIYAEVDHQEIEVEIWDTAGQDKLQNITKSQFQNRNGFIFFFDVTNKKSFNDIEKWIKKTEKITDLKNKLIYLVANKIDLIEERKVSKEDIKNYAEKRGIIYQECSCKNGIGVYEIMNEIIYSVICDPYNCKIDLNNSKNPIKVSKNTNNKKSSCC